MSASHGTEPAGIETVPRSRFHGGRFGRLFRHLEPAGHSEEHLEALGNAMVDERPERPSGGWGGPPKPDDGDNPDIPAGYTYFGQFVDHDITFDPASSLLRSNDPEALHNFRTPRFDLDSLYGDGPADDPYLYEGDSGRLRLGPDRGGRPDLQRTSTQPERALIGDPRNDENAIVNQIQVLFIQAHNKLVDELGDFERARTALRWHYQWIVVNDFLARIAGRDVVDDILRRKAHRAGGEDVELWDPRLCFFHPHEQPFMPVEFSVAAYRFGHSMVRAEYLLRSGEEPKPIFKDVPQGTGEDLTGFGPRHESLALEWSLFFPVDREPVPQGSRLIDTKLALPLHNLSFLGNASLAVKNLLRGRALDLPSGQAVAMRMGVEPLSDAELGLESLDLPGDAATALEESTPLWFYILREAELRGEGRRLGPVGGRIVAETLIGLLAGDPHAYLRKPRWDPLWAEDIPQQGESFEMADLVRFVAD